jgi:hypothetical protein
LTPTEIAEIEAAVDASFTDQKRPVFRVGSLKWVGVWKWCFYINLFFALSMGDQVSLAMSPVEYLRAWEEEPRLMAIVSIIQARVRVKMGERLDATRRKAEHGQGHLSNSSTVKR